MGPTDRPALNKWGQAPSQSSLTSEGEPAPLAPDFLNVTASEAESFLDDAKAVKSQRTEKPTELHRSYSSESSASAVWSGTSIPVQPTTGR